MKEGATKSYELTFILGEKATPESGKTKTESVKKLVKDLGGTVSKEELWGRRELAYEIKGNRSGFYITLWLEITGENLKKLQQELNFDESIIRFLATKAYTTAQPGTLYPIVETEKTEKTAAAKTDKDTESVSAEEMLRRSSSAGKNADLEMEDVDDLPEEERLEKLDEALEELLKDQE